MTPRELSALRDLVTRARFGNECPAETTQREEWATKKRIWRAKRSGWCVYCGVRIKDKRGRYEVALTCIEHRDLPRLDPKYVFLEKKAVLA